MTGQPKVIRDKAMLVPYWLALGEFIHEFTIVECAITTYCQRLSKVPPRLANAAIPPFRIDAGKDALNRLLLARGMTKRKHKIEPLLEQLGVISQVRNNVLHWGLRSANGKSVLVSNRIFAASKDRVREYPITVPELRQMTSDLSKIYMLIGKHFGMVNTRSNARRAFFAALEQRPWQYKRRSPPPQKKARPKRLPAPSRPPEPSSA